MWTYWLGLLLLLLIVEAMTVNLTTIWFAAGALVALIANVLGAEMWLQLSLFLLVSALGLVLFFFVFKPKLSQGKSKKISTNADRIIGQEGMVTVAIDTLLSKGQIEVMGQAWSAVSDLNPQIPAGERVLVESIRGVRAVVRLLPKDE